MGIEVSMVSSFAELDKYVPGGVSTIEHPDLGTHELRFFHRKGVSTLKVHEKDTGEFIYQSLNKAIKKMQSKLKPNHKKAPLIVAVLSGRNNPEDTIVRVGVRSIMKGLAKPEELFLPEGLH